MNEAEFDKFADEYQAALAAGIRLSGEGPAYFSEYKLADIARAWQAAGHAVDTPVRMLDFGAGTGNSVPYVHKHFGKAELTCVDLSRRSLNVASKRFPGQADYVHFDGTHLPFPAETFDIAFAMVVFHHIPHDQHLALLEELRRVLRPDGSLFIFEHNPLNPLTVRVVNNCPFDENAELIRSHALRARMAQAGFSSTSTQYRVFFPHGLRFLRPMERVLTWLPLGGQYCVQARK
jgi:ubiquinone/menaquinone biosynthesis C-methylase UbiE